MSALTIQMFGGLCVSHQNRTWHPSDHCKVQELFCYLLLHRHTPCSREALANQFWGNNTTEQSKKNLRQTLWRLQTTYGPYLENSDDHLLELRTERVRLNPALDLWVDVEVFEQAFAALQTQAQLSEEAAQLLREAVALYHGDFLSGWYHDWCLIERERFQNMYLEMLDRLIRLSIGRREYQTGLFYAEQVLRCHPASERTFQQIMQMQYWNGNRSEALHQYERCACALQEDLGVSPSRKTQSLYEQICTDNLAATVTSQAIIIPSPSTALASLPEVLAQLKQFQTTLADMQQQLQLNIHLVEGCLSERDRIQPP